MSLNEKHLEQSFEDRQNSQIYIQEVKSLQPNEDFNVSKGLRAFVYYRNKFNQKTYQQLTKKEGKHVIQRRKQIFRNCYRNY